MLDMLVISDGERLEIRFRRWREHVEFRKDGGTLRLPGHWGDWCKTNPNVSYDVENAKGAESRIAKLKEAHKTVGNKLEFKIVKTRVIKTEEDLR